MNKINYLGNEPTDGVCYQCGHYYSIVDEEDGLSTEQGLCGKNKKVVTEDGYCDEFREVKNERMDM